MPGRASQDGRPGLRPVGWAGDVGGGTRRVCRHWSPSARASGDRLANDRRAVLEAAPHSCTSGAAIPTHLPHCPRIPQLDRGSASPWNKLQEASVSPPFPLHPHSRSSLPSKPPAPNQFLDSSSASQGPLSGDRGCQRQSHLLASCTSIHPPHPSSQARPQTPFTCSISRAQADRWVASPTDGEIVWAKHVNPCSAWPSPDGSRDLLGGPGEAQQAFPAPAPPSTGRPLHFPKPSVVPVPCHQPRVSPRTLSRLHQPSFVHEGNLDSRGQECALPMPGPPPFAKALLILQFQLKCCFLQEALPDCSGWGISPVSFHPQPTPHLPALTLGIQSASRT